MKMVRCATCGKPIEVSADDKNKLHWCGNGKDDECIMAYWRRLHEEYRTK